eukprot:gene5540-6891_t
MTSSTDRIERNILINAPRAKVWDALTNAEKFGDWFGAKLKGQLFVPGKQTLGSITICNFEHVMFDAIVERIEPQPEDPLRAALTALGQNARGEVGIGVKRQ